MKSIVSRETEIKLRRYEQLLKKWQKSINLVGPNTVANAWERHFLDSAQIASLIPNASQVLLDFGSGAGFPGMVVAIIRPDLVVYLMESNQRKCSFLKTVSRETSVSVNIINERIESANLKAIPDIITARALADLSTLLKLSTVYAQQNPLLILLFLKGQNADEEIAEAQKLFNFECLKLPSHVDSQGCIIKITKLQIRTG